MGDIASGMPLGCSLTADFSGLVCETDDGKRIGATGEDPREKMAGVGEGVDARAWMMGERMTANRTSSLLSGTMSTSGGTSSDGLGRSSQIAVMFSTFIASSSSSCFACATASRHIATDSGYPEGGSGRSA